MSSNGKTAGLYFKVLPVPVKIGEAIIKIHLYTPTPAHKQPEILSRLLHILKVNGDISRLADIYPEEKLTLQLLKSVLSNGQIMIKKLNDIHARGVLESQVDGYEIYLCLQCPKEVKS